MTFEEKYHTAESWQDKILIMNIYHCAMSRTDKTWTIRKTATVFSVSIGLVSENIRLARAIDTGVKIMSCKTRQEALNKLK